MIRLGSAAGYLFEGPRLLGGWLPPGRPGVYAVMYRLPESSRYAVIYVAHADDLSTAGLPFRHPKTPCWTERAGDKWKLHTAWYEIPGDTRPHREQVVAELITFYSPHCNTERFDHTWRPEWIGSAGCGTPTSPS